MKKTRLLEIVREEIASALNEKLLNEKPNIDGPLDFTLKSPNKPITPDNINQGALQKAIDNAVETIKKEYPEYNSNKLSNLIMKVNGKKELKADSFSPEILKALKTVKDTIEQQYDVFGDHPEAKAKLTQFIKDYKTEINPEAKSQLEKFASGDKKFTDTIGYNQTETATEKSLGIKPKKAADILSTNSSTEKKSPSDKPKKEKPESTGKKGRPAGTKTATRTPGDDGFDDVSYSDEEVEDTYYKDEDEFTSPSEEGPSSAEITGDKTAKELGAKAEKMAQLQKFMKKMKDEGVVGGDNKILNKEKYKEEFDKFKAELK